MGYLEAIYAGEAFSVTTNTISGRAQA